MRVIGKDGENFGVLKIEEALQKAKEQELDLIEIAPTAVPPVAKIMEYGKYLYWLQKKEKGVKRGVEIKGIRLGFNISLHDLETRANQAEGFLKKGDRVKVEMILKGREKALSDFAKGKLHQFIEILEKKIPIKIDRELKKEFKGFTLLISKK